MITIFLDGQIRCVDFGEFERLVRQGGLPPDVLMRGDVLTGGQTVRAGDLRTYAIPRDPDEPTLDSTLALIRWYPSVRIKPQGRTEPERG